MAQVQANRHLLDRWDRERTSVSCHFLRDLESLWSEMLKLAWSVQEELYAAVRALGEHRPDLSDYVLEQDALLHAKYDVLEQECWTILARYQPVASDLRRIRTVLKVCEDLERLCELARSLAARAAKLASLPDPVAIPARLEILAKEALDQVRLAFDALSDSDAELARQIVAADPQIDQVYNQVVRELTLAIRREPEQVDTWLRLIDSARNLEQIADHATRVAEAVVYHREGRVNRRSADTN